MINLKISERNRGKASNDDSLFGEKWHAAFKKAVYDYAYLLSKGYGQKSSLELVGNRYKLNKRQRLGILRMGVADQNVSKRKSRQCVANDLAGKNVIIDGFNLLILLESVLSGAYVFKCMDGTYRDISGIHGSYKRVAKTPAAILTVGETLKELKVGKVVWYLDSPVSNSGRLKKILEDISGQNQFNWKINLVFNPDQEILKEKGIVVSSDGWILDRADKWFNLGAYIIEEKPGEPNVVYPG